MPPRPRKKTVVNDDIPVEDEVPIEDPALAPLTAAEAEILHEAVSVGVEAEILHEAVSVGVETDEPPVDPEDWPEPAVELIPEVTAVELRSLRPDQRPLAGAHYVIFGGKPVPVTREFAQTEDEFVRSQLNVSDELRDHDGNRVARADRTLRMRYRGYVCGEMTSL